MLLNKVRRCKEGPCRNQGPQDAQERHAGGFHGGEFLVAGEVAQAMMEATNASGRAKDNRAEAKTMSLNTTHNSKPLPIMSSA